MNFKSVMLCALLVLSLDSRAEIPSYRDLLKKKQLSQTMEKTVQKPHLFGFESLISDGEPLNYERRELFKMRFGALMSLRLSLTKLEFSLKL